MFDGKRILITGHSGFKGSWLSLWLQDLGATVFGLSLPQQDPLALFSFLDLASKVDSTWVDIRDAAAVMRAFESFSPHIVIHNAAQALVLQSYEDPLGTYATNVQGTVHVLEAARRVKNLEQILVVTSDKVYDNLEWIWPYRENDRLGGYDPYSNSKACCELVVASYTRSFFEKAGVCVATARAGNVFGGGDRAHFRLIPDAVRAFEKGEPLFLRQPHATRPWQHVLDCLYGYITLLKEKKSGSWNFGPDETYSVAAVMERFSCSWGHKASWQSPLETRPHEAHTLKLDSSKAKKELHWQPQFDIDTALEMTALWYKTQASASPQKLLGLTLDQIRSMREVIV